MNDKISKEERERAEREILGPTHDWPWRISNRHFSEVARGFAHHAAEQVKKGNDECMYHDVKKGIGTGGGYAIMYCHGCGLHRLLELEERP